MLPPGGRVAAYLRSTGLANYDPPEVAENLHTTLSAALKTCRSGAGDVIMALRGHSEDVIDNTMMNDLVAGTKIVGQGSSMEESAPTFRFTTQTAEWLINQHDVGLFNLHLQARANPVDKCINVTGRGFSMAGCQNRVAAGGTLKAAIFLEIGSGAFRASILGNYFWGTTADHIVDGIKVVGGSTPGQLRIVDNVMIASATAGNGLIHITVAAAQVYIGHNSIFSQGTNSTACIVVDNVAAAGIIEHNSVATTNNGTATAQGIVLGGASLFRCFQNFSSDEPNRSGVLTPVVVAT